MSEPILVTENAPFPLVETYAEGEVRYCVHRFVQGWENDPDLVECRFFRRAKAAKHAMNRYPDAQLKRLVFVNGGWVSVE